MSEEQYKVAAFMLRSEIEAKAGLQAFQAQILNSKIVCVYYKPPGCPSNVYGRARALEDV